MQTVKTKKAWMKYANMFLRGFSIGQVAEHYGVYAQTVETAIRHFVKAGGG